MKSCIEDGKNGSIDRRGYGHRFFLGFVRHYFQYYGVNNQGTILSWFIGPIWCWIEAKTAPLDDEKELFHQVIAKAKLVLYTTNGCLVHHVLQSRSHAMNFSFKIRKKGFGGKCLILNKKYRPILRSSTRTYYYNGVKNFF